MDEKFTSVVVSLDLEGHDDRTIEVARSLATLADLPIELVIALPERYERGSGVRPLEQLARAHDLANWIPTVLLGNEPATAIADHLQMLHAPLLVASSPAHSVLGEIVWTSTTAGLLVRVHSPLLVLGPHVPSTWRATVPTLLACVGPSSHADPVVDAMAQWMHTFGGHAPWFLEVLSPAYLPPDTDDLHESAVVQRRAERLAELGVESQWDVLHGDDPVGAIERFADEVAQSVLVVSSERWTDPSRLHLHSVSRRLAHRAHQPVLVIPPLGDRASARSHDDDGHHAALEDAVDRGPDQPSGNRAMTA